MSLSDEIQNICRSFLPGLNQALQITLGHSFPLLGAELDG